MWHESHPDFPREEAASSHSHRLRGVGDQFGKKLVMHFGAVLLLRFSLHGLPPNNSFKPNQLRGSA